MDSLDFLFRPTIAALAEEDCIDAENEDALLLEQGFRSEPVSIQKGDAFEVPEGMEAVPDDCRCFLECDKDDPGFVIEKNGVWFDPEGIGILSSGRYLYKGNGIIQRRDDDQTVDE
jgi:hypothetical protein